VVQQAILRSQEIAKKESVKIHSRMPPDPVLVNADIEQIRRVLEELILNAIHFSGGNEVIITVRQELNGQAYLAVQDMGPGIAEEHHKFIFHPFYKIEATSNAEDHGGLGIGLALAKEVIKAHGSELRVKSRLGYGSTFYFTLPSLNSG
jgi:signal transduction histidine kinase